MCLRKSGNSAKEFYSIQRQIQRTTRNENCCVLGRAKLGKRILQYTTDVFKGLHTKRELSLRESENSTTELYCIQRRIQKTVRNDNCSSGRAETRQKNYIVSNDGFRGLNETRTVPQGERKLGTSNLDSSDQLLIERERDYQGLLYSANTQLSTSFKRFSKTIWI